MAEPATQRLLDILPEGEKLIAMGARTAIALLVAFLLQRLLYVFVNRLERWLARTDPGNQQVQARAHTLGQIFRSLGTVFIAIGALVYALNVFGWDVRPLLATAGIAGVALGFGAQTLVRDVIAGLFILTENQFTVGELIEVNGKPATVEAMSVRSTVLRDFNGFLYFVPNGELKTVVNRSRGWTRLALDLPVALGQDVDRALEVCREVTARMNAEPDWRRRLLDPIALWGVEALGNQDVQLRFVVRARPGGDAHEALRELRRRLHAALSEAGIRAGTRSDLGALPVGGAGRPS